MDLHIIFNHIKTRYVLSVLLIIVHIFLLSNINYCIGKENERYAELMDISGERIKISSIRGSNIILSLCCKDIHGTSLNEFGSVKANLESLQSIKLIDNDRLYKVKFTDGTEVSGVRISGMLYGKSMISGIPSVDISISLSDINDIAFSGIDNRITTLKRSGLSANLNLDSLGKLDLFNITTKDLHESAVYYGLFYGDRKDVIPIIVDGYELDIPLNWIRKINFIDTTINKTPLEILNSDKSLIVDIVYREPNALTDIILKGKRIGYAIKYSGYDIRELEINGQNWIGTWVFRLRQGYSGRGLISIENFSTDPNKKEVNEKNQESNHGICTTLDGKQWLIKEFRDFKLSVKIGKSEVSLPYDKVKKITIEKNENKRNQRNGVLSHLEIILVNDEKISGEGNFDGGIIAFDKQGLIVRIPSSLIKDISKN